MRGAANAARSELYFPGAALAIAMNSAVSARRQFRIGDDHQRKPRHQGDAGEIGAHVIARVFRDERQRGMPGPGKQERVAVRLALRDHAGRDRAAGAADVLDQHALGQLLAQAVGEDAGHQIDAAAGRDRDDQFDRPCRPGVLRGRSRAQQHHRDDERFPKFLIWLPAMLQSPREVLAWARSSTRCEPRPSSGLTAGLLIINFDARSNPAASRDRRDNAATVRRRARARPERQWTWQIQTTLAWPNGKRIAVAVTVMYETWAEGKAPNYSVQTTHLKPGTVDLAGAHGRPMAAGSACGGSSARSTACRFPRRSSLMRAAPSSIPTASSRS